MTPVNRSIVLAGLMSLPLGGACSNEPVVGRGLRLEVRDSTGNPIGGATIVHTIQIRRNHAVALSSEDTTMVDQLVNTSQPIEVDTLPTDGIRELTGRIVAPGILEILRADVPARVAAAAVEVVRILAIQAPGYRTVLDDRYEFELAPLSPELPSPVETMTMETE